MAVGLDRTLTRQVGFDGGIVVDFPVIYRYEQIIAEVAGYDPEETGEIERRVHYGYSEHPVIRIANVVASSAVPISTLDLDRDGQIWIVCHRHRNAGERAAYAHAVLMGRHPGDGLAPAAIEYETPDGHFTIFTRRPPAGAPAGLMVYGCSYDDERGQSTATMAIDRDGQIARPEAYLFAFVPLPVDKGLPGDMS